MKTVFTRVTITYDIFCDNDIKDEICAWCESTFGPKTLPNTRCSRLWFSVPTVEWEYRLSRNKENVLIQWTSGVPTLRFYFRNAADATVFALRWGDYLYVRHDETDINNC